MTDAYGASTPAGVPFAGCAVMSDKSDESDKSDMSDKSDVLPKLIGLHSTAASAARSIGVG